MLSLSSFSNSGRHGFWSPFSERMQLEPLSAVFIWAVPAGSGRGSEEVAGSGPRGRSSSGAPVPSLKSSHDSSGSFKAKLVRVTAQEVMLESVEAVELRDGFRSMISVMLSPHDLSLFPEMRGKIEALEGHLGWILYGLFSNPLLAKTRRSLKDLTIITTIYSLYIQIFCL